MTYVHTQTRENILLNFQELLQSLNVAPYLSSQNKRITIAYKRLQKGGCTLTMIVFLKVLIKTSRE